MNKIYLDDIRTPKTTDWIVVRNYDEFIKKIIEIGLDNIEQISLDHDLGETATNEYFENTKSNYVINYENIKEKTGYDCAKWLVDYYYDSKSSTFPTIYTHSANPVGSANIMGYINNFRKNEKMKQNCVRVQIEHTIDYSLINRQL